MAWRDWLRKSNPVSDLIILNLFGEHQIIVPKVSLVAQANDGYLRNVTVYACINLIARSCAGIPWVLYQRKGGEKPKKLMTLATASKAMQGSQLLKAAVEKSEIENHPLLRLIEKPNPLQSGAEYLEEVQSYIGMTGNSYEKWEAPEGGPNAGRPVEMWSLRPDRMYIVGGVLGSGRIVSKYRYWVGAGQIDFEPDTILHSRYFSPLDDFYGLSPIQVAALVIDGDNAAQLWNQKLLTNDARPSAALMVKGTLQEDDRTRLKLDLEQRYSGPSNARRPMILEGDVDWKVLSLSPADLDWLNGRKLNRREIAQAFNVPPELIGDVDAQGYASKEQARKALYQENILPTMDRRRDNLNNSLTPRFGDGLYLDYDRDQIEALHEDTTKLFQGLRQADWLSLNEKRAATGYDEYTNTADVDAQPSDVPVALLKPSQLPGAPEDPANPGGSQTLNAPPAPGDPGAKAQSLSRVQKQIESDLEEKLNKGFRKQAKALAAHIKAGVR